MPPLSKGQRGHEAPPTPLGPGYARPDTATPRRTPVRLTRSGAWWRGAAGVAVVLPLLLAFVLQNDQSVRVSFMGEHGTVPVGIVTVLAAAAGALLVAVPAAGRISELRRIAQDRTPGHAAPGPGPGPGPRRVPTGVDPFGDDASGMRQG